MYACHQGGATVDRECDSPRVKHIRKVCQFVGRCDEHGGDVRRPWGIL